MVERHISLPKPFLSGDAKDLLQRFEICSVANGWKAEDQAIKLPMLLEGEAITVWLELTTEQQKEYETAKKEIRNAVMPVMAIPGMNKEVKDPLLLHQFVAGLPEPITKQLRASGEVKTLEAAVTCSRLLMTID